MQPQQRNNRSTIRDESDDRDPSIERARTRFSHASDGYLSIRIDYIARVHNVERLFRRALETLEEDCGPINWVETRVIVPRDNWTRPAHCFLHFLNTRVHERVVEDLNGAQFEGETTRWSLSWFSRQRPRPEPTEERARSPVRREARNVRPTSPPRSSITAAAAAAPNAQEPEKLPAEVDGQSLAELIRELTLQSASQATTQNEPRMSALVNEAVDQALQRTLAPLIAAQAQRIVDAPTYRTGSWGEASHAAVCSVCLEKLADKDEPSVMALNCGHCFCRNCCDRIRLADPQLAPLMRCPTCRDISEPHRLVLSGL